MITKQNLLSIERVGVTDSSCFDYYLKELVKSKQLRGSEIRITSETYL